MKKARTCKKRSTTKKKELQDRKSRVVVYSGHRLPGGWPRIRRIITITEFSLSKYLSPTWNPPAQGDKSTEHLAKLISLRLHFPSSIFSSSWFHHLFTENNFIIIPLHISCLNLKISSIHLSFNTSKIRFIIFLSKAVFPSPLLSTEDHRE